MPQRKHSKKPEQMGDVIGISHAKGSIPQHKTGTGGHPDGIDVRREGHSIQDLNQGPGATSIDMGAAGEGNTVKRRR